MVPRGAAPRLLEPAAFLGNTGAYFASEGEGVAQGTAAGSWARASRAHPAAAALICWNNCFETVLGTGGGPQKREARGRREKKCGGGRALGLSSPRTQESGRASCKGSRQPHPRRAPRTLGPLSARRGLQNPPKSGERREGQGRGAPPSPKGCWGVSGSPFPLQARVRCRRLRNRFWTQLCALAPDG